MPTRQADRRAFARAVPRLGRMAAGVGLSLLGAATLCAATLCATTLCATTLWAQEGEGGGGTIIPSTRSWIIEAVIVGAMVALALFVVCRSSRRQ